jgi:Tfp pilus assembly protein PilX
MNRMMRTRREEGAALLLILGAVMVLMILGAAIFLVARVSLERAAANTDSGRALAAAESGLQNTASALSTSPVVPSATPVTLPLTDMAGDGQYEATYVAPTALPWFSITSTGYYATKADALGRRRIKAECFALSPWDFIYAGGMTGATVNGNVSVHGPFYVNDDLTMSGDAGVYGGPLILYNTSAPGNADVNLESNSARLGDPSKYITIFMDGQIYTPPAGGDLYLEDVYPWAPELSFPDLTEEELDNYRYDNASSPWLGDLERPTAVWDTDSTTNYSTGLTFNKTNKPLATDARLKGTKVTWRWEGTNNKPNLIITFDNSGGVRPILFIDGDLTITGGAGGLNAVRYEGVGTIVVSGRIAISGNLVPNGSTLAGKPAQCAGFPDTNALGLVTRNDVDFYGQQDEWLAAAVYAGGEATFSKQGNLRGALVTREMNLGTQIPELWAEGGFSFKLPPRMPGADTRIRSIIGWTELNPYG